MVGDERVSMGMVEQIRGRDERGCERRMVWNARIGRAEEGRRCEAR